MAARTDELLTYLTSVKEQLTACQGQVSQHATHRNTLTRLCDDQYARLCPEESSLLTANESLKAAKGAHEAVASVHTAEDKAYRAAHVMYQKALRAWEMAKERHDGHMRQYQATTDAVANAQGTREAAESARARGGW